MHKSHELHCTTIKESFAIALSTWRRKHNMPLKQMASDLGISIATVSSWERGQRFPSESHFEMLVTYTGLPPCRLFCVMADKCIPPVCYRILPKK